MSHFDEMNTLQYMGSKSRIIDEICSPIMENQSIETVVDLFAGTGTVGYALKPYFSIISNDLEYYAYVLNEGILNGCDISDNQLGSILTSSKNLANRIKSFCADAVVEEAHFFEKEALESVIADYQRFCNDTPSIISPDTNNCIFDGLAALVARVIPGQEKQNIDMPVLFLTYYANAYFGISQCCEIDAICDCIANIGDKRVQYVLLSALMTAMSDTASTTTHFAQYLKINGISSYKNIVNKRRTSIIDLFTQYIDVFKQKGLLSLKAPKAECKNLDYLELLHSIPLDETIMVYADPPYFKEHYSRYYHILNTLCKYDYPRIAPNPQTHEFSVGRYREERNVSDFGKRKTALAAFKELIKVCGQSKAWLTISYSNNSIVNIEDILAVMNEYYEVQSTSIPLKHSKQGRASTSDVKEFLFTGKPLNARKVVGQKQVCELLETLSVTKPQTDNPVGFMHNYMARKPFNIVSEIIKHLSPEKGIVYDPMVGSGTTLIEASKLGISSIGTDINLLAYKISSVSLGSWDLSRVREILNDFFDSVVERCETLYSFEENSEMRIIERCHFNKISVDPQELEPTSYWYKVITNGKISGRKKAGVTPAFIEQYRQYEQSQLHNIRDAALIPNSRIAIGPNDTVNMYFCARNLVALDIIIGELKKRKNRYGYPILELLISSAINLIKLSDKKASSQMPYWTPKMNVTSRNAILILQKKKDTIFEGLKFIDSECHAKTVRSYTDLASKTGVLIRDCPAQNISYSTLPRQSVDLVLTDPPYTDQVPYLEYCQLWSHVLGWEKGFDKRLNKELVVSDAPSRDKDITDFNAVFENIIKRTANSMKDGSHFVMFYHSFDIVSWNNILTLMGKYGLAYQGQAPIGSPRKSFKTIMSPNSTLDGNYVIVFRKRQQHQPVFEGSIVDAEKAAMDCARKIIQENNKTTSQDLYDRGMLKDSVEKGYLGLLASKYHSFVDVIASSFKYEKGYWREK